MLAISYSFRSLCKISTALSSNKNTFLQACPKLDESDAYYLAIGINSTIYQKIIESNGYTENGISIRFPSKINCFCYTTNGSFILVATNDGRVSICSKDHGILFSQNIRRAEEECFSGIQWLGQEANGSIILVTRNCELVVIEGVHLSVLEQSFLEEKASVLMQERKNIQILTYDLSSFFSSIQVVQCDSDDSILIGGSGECCLVRMRIDNSHYSILKKLKSDLIHSEGIKHVSFSSDMLFIVTTDGTLLVLDSSSFFIISYYNQTPIQSAYNIPDSLSPILSSRFCFLVTKEEVFLAEIGFGEMRVVNSEYHSDVLGLYFTQFILDFDDHGVEIKQLFLATERQRYLNLISNEQFEEALAYASQKGFDKSLVYKKQIHIQLRKWKEELVDNWLEEDAKDCSELFNMIRSTQLTLLLYVCEYEDIPSRKTVEALLSFGNETLMREYGFDEDKMKFLLLSLKWKVFMKAISHMEKVDCHLWKRFHNLSLLQIQGFLLQLNEMRLVLILWSEFVQIFELFELFSELEEVQEFLKQSLLQFARVFTLRQQKQLSIQKEMVTWLTQFILHYCSSEYKTYFIEWLLQYCTIQLSTTIEDDKEYLLCLTNIQTVTHHVMELPWVENESMHSIIRFHSYFSGLLSIFNLLHMRLPFSPTLSIPSDEELSIRALDELKTVEVLSQFFDRLFIPFCVARNMNPDEVCSYYLQQELEKTDIDFQRIQFIWHRIHSHDYQVEALKTLISRPPPYSGDILSLVTLCSQYKDLSPKNYLFIQEHEAMLLLRNRIYERGLNALLLMGGTPCYVILNSLISRYDSQTMQDLKLLTVVYREISMEDALISLSMAVLEDGDDEILLMELVAWFLEHHCCFSIMTLVDYGVELMDTQDSSLWKKRCTCLQKALSVINSNTWIEKELHTYQYPIKMISQQINNAMLFASCFDFCVTSLYITDTNHYVEKMVTESVQTSGYENPYTQQRFMYDRSFSIRQKALIEQVLDVPQDLLDLLSIDQAIVSVLKGTNLISYPNFFSELHSSSHSHNKWLGYFDSLIPLLFDDLISALSFNIQLLHSKRFTKEDRGHLLSIVDNALLLCCFIITHLELGKYYFKIASKNHLIWMSLKKVLSPQVLAPLPYTVYEETGLTMEPALLYDLIGCTLMSITDHEAVSDELYATSINCCINHQLEYTSLPLIARYASSHNLARLYQQVITRSLLAYSSDFHVVLLGLLAVPSTFSSQLITNLLSMGSGNGKEIVHLGVYFGYLLRDRSVLRHFVVLSHSVAWSLDLGISVFNPQQFINSIPSYIYQMSSNSQFVLENHIAEILEFQNLSEDPIAFYVAVLHGCVISNNAKAIIRCIEAEKYLIPHQINEVIQSCLKKLKGTEIHSIHLLYSQLHNSDCDQAKVEQMLYLTDYIASHPELEDVNLYDIMKDPWKHVQNRITLYNYRDYLLFLSYCGSSGDDLYLFLLQSIVDSTHTPEWLSVNEIISSLSIKQSQRVAEMCLQISKKYYQDDHYCTTFPCSLCQDRVDAAACARQFMVEEDPAIEDNYCNAVFEYQRNRLLLGDDPVPSSIQHLHLIEAWRNEAEVRLMSTSLYCQLAMFGGKTLQKHFKEYCHNRLSITESNPRKRPKVTNVVPNDKEKTYELQDDKESNQHMMDGLQPAWFFFNGEGCGSLYVHSFMKILCTLCKLPFETIYEHVIEMLLVSLYQGNQWKEEEGDEKEENVVYSLLYMLEGYFQLDASTFESRIQTYLNRALDLEDYSLSYIARYLLLTALKLLPIQVRGLTAQKELPFFIIAGCQRHFISIGEDAVAQASNVNFLHSIITRPQMNSNLIWWIYRMCKRLNIQDKAIWEQLVVRAEELNEHKLILICCAEKTIQLSVNVLEQAIAQQQNANLLLKVLLQQSNLEDDYLLQLCNKLVTVPGIDMELVVSVVMQMINREKRKTGLQLIIINGDAMAVLPFIVVNRIPLEMYQDVFEQAIKQLIHKKCYSQLFLSDYYDEAIEYCMKDKALLNKWIVYHIKERQFREAEQLIQYVDDFVVSESLIDTLSDYVIKVLQDEQLLPFLLSL